MNSILSKSAKSFAAVVTVHPRPTTLSHTSAIFTRLQDFGKVVSFTSPAFRPRESRIAHGDTKEEYKILIQYDSADGVARVIGSSPLHVGVNHDLPDPQVLDPFDVRGLQLRSRPTAVQFTCHVVDHEELKDPDERADVHRVVAGERCTSTARKTQPKLYQDLLAASAPLGIVEGLASVVDEGLTMTAHAQEFTLQTAPATASRGTMENSEDKVKEFLHSSDALTSSSLMTVYRESIRTGEKKLEPTTPRPSRKERYRQRSQRYHDLQARSAITASTREDLPDS